MNGLCCTYIGMETKLQIGIWHPKACKGTKAGAASFGRVTSKSFCENDNICRWCKQVWPTDPNSQKDKPCCLFRKCLRIPNENIELFFFCNKNHKQVQKAEAVSVLLGCFVSWKSIRFPSVTRAGISKTRRILGNKKPGAFWSEEFWLRTSLCLMLRLDFLGLKDKSERRVSWVAERWVRVVSNLKD